MWSYFKLIGWGTFWFIIWAATFPWRNGRENCLTWAVDKWDKQGGYLVIRWCRYNKQPWIKWPHFLWLDDKYHHYLEHIIPQEELETGESELRTVPKMWFDPVNIVSDPDDGTYREN